MEYSLDELYNMVDKELRLDKTELTNESVRTPYIYSKYLKLYTTYGLKFKKIEKEYDALYKERWEYYNGKSDEEVYKEEPFELKVIRGDIPMYLKADKKLSVLEEKKEYYFGCVNYLERVLKMIDNRNWNIRNIIEWEKFKNGII